MDKHNANSLAFPGTRPELFQSGGIESYVVATHHGLTKREYAAIAIFSGMIATGQPQKSSREEYAKTAVIFADAVIAVLTETEQK